MFQDLVTRIGRLEVGTESQIDKSKSVKSNLLRLFQTCKSLSADDEDDLNVLDAEGLVLLICIFAWFGFAAFTVLSIWFYCLYTFRSAQSNTVVSSVDCRLHICVYHVTKLILVFFFQLVCYFFFLYFYLGVDCMNACFSATCSTPSFFTVQRFFSKIFITSKLSLLLHF